MTGAAAPGASLWRFSTTLMGWSAVTVTAYCVPPASAASYSGSMNFERPGSMLRVMTAILVPSKETKRALAIVGDEPKGATL